jgi:hypothetical protein
MLPAGETVSFKIFGRVISVRIVDKRFCASDEKQRMLYTDGVVQ